MVRSKQAVSIDRNSPSTGSGSKVQMGIANRGLRTYSQSQYRNNKRRESIASSAAFSRLGQQEALKHDKMMKLRKHQQHLQQLRSSNHENGKLKTAAAFVLRSGAQDRSASPQLVKRSVNPRKAAVVVAAAAATAAQSESESTSPNDDSHSTSGLQNGVENSSGAAKLKINVEFEDTDDDEENEGLKKVMENIEKDLNVAEDLKKGLLTKRSHAPSAPVNESWLEFGDKSAKKIKGMSRTDGNDSAKHDSEMVLTKLRENELKDCNGDDHSTVSAGLQDGQVEFKSPSDVSVDTDSSKGIVLKICIKLL